MGCSRKTDIRTNDMVGDSRIRKRKSGGNGVEDKHIALRG